MKKMQTPVFSIKKEIEREESVQRIAEALQNRSRKIWGFGGVVYITIDIVKSIVSIRQMIFRAERASFNNTDPGKQELIDRNIAELNQVKETLMTYSIQINTLKLINQDLKAEIDLLKKAQK